MLMYNMLWSWSAVLFEVLAGHYMTQKYFPASRAGVFAELHPVAIGRPSLCRTAKYRPQSSRTLGTVFMPREGASHRSNSWHDLGWLGHILWCNSVIFYGSFNSPTSYWRADTLTHIPQQSEQEQECPSETIPCRYWLGQNPRGSQNSQQIVLLQKTYPQQQWKRVLSPPGAALRAYTHIYTCIYTLVMQSPCSPRWQHWSQQSLADLQGQ